MSRRRRQPTSAWRSFDSVDSAAVGASVTVRTYQRTPPADGDDADASAADPVGEVGEVGGAEAAVADVSVGAGGRYRAAS